jgi:hypothetical protein
VGRRGLRRGPGSLSRSAALAALRRAPSAGSIPMRRCGVRRSAPLHHPKRRGEPNPWNGAFEPPRRSAFPVPTRRDARLPEGRRLPSPGGVVRSEIRRTPIVVPRWRRAPGAPKRSVCRTPMGRVCLPQMGGDGCARKRFQYDDAPIRRSGPPRHRAHELLWCRSTEATK